MAHYRIFRIGVRKFAEGESLRFIFEDIGLTDEIGASSPLVNRPLDEGLGLSDEIGAFRELPPVGFSSEIGFNDEIADTGFWFQGKYFGTLQNSYENGTLYNSPTLGDYWVTTNGSNSGVYWDDNLDTSDLEMVVVFRLDYADLINIPTTHGLIFKSGNGTNGLAISVLRFSNNQPYLRITAASTASLTSIEINLKSISLDTGVWLELFATPTKLVLREYDTPSNSFSVVGSWTSGYADYYESIGFSLGASPLSGSTGYYFNGSIRSIDYYHIGKIDMPADVSFYPYHFYAHFGTNNEGNGGRAGENGTPTVGTEWVTFDGNDGYHWSSVSEIPNTDVDFYFVFRLEEDHLDVLTDYYTLMQVGNATDGFALGIKDREFGFVSRNNGTLKENKVSVYNLELNVWYEAFLSSSKITIREEATPANGITQSATVDINTDNSPYPGIGCAVVGTVWSGLGGSWQEYTQCSVKKWIMDKKGGLVFPSDLSAPVAGPIWRWNYGSDVGGTYGGSQSGSPTINTDNLYFDGNDALHWASWRTDPHDRAWVVEFEYTNSFSGSTQVIWKVGDETAGIAFGSDSSGNFGAFARSSSTLTSITVSASTYLSVNTKYLLYATDTGIKIFEPSPLSLVAEASGTLTIGTLPGSSDQDSLGGHVYGSPIDGNTDTWGSYFTGKVYSIEYWDEADFSFPPSNWYHSESGIGFADSVEGDVNTAIVNISEGIGFSETIEGEVGSEQKESSSTFGLNDTVTGTQVSTQKQFSSTIGFNDQAQVDHIDETTGQAESTIGFNDTIGGYNSFSYKEAASTFGLNDESFGHAVLRNKGVSEGIGFNDDVDAYNSMIHKEAASTFGFNDEIVGQNIVTEHESTSTLGFADTIGVNLESIAESTSEIGFGDAAYANIAQYDRELSHTLGFADAVYGGLPGSPDMEVETLGLSDNIDATHYPVKHVESEFGLNDLIGAVWQYEVHSESTLGFSDSPFVENAGNLRPNIPATLRYRFYLTLTGANDSLDDFEITELKTVQLRLKSGTMASNLIASVIYSEEKETAIEARTNGTFILEMASVYNGIELLREQLVEVNYRDARYDIGGTSSSITLNGYRVLSYNTDIAFVANALYKKTTQNGRVNYRFPRPDFYVRPGYKCVYENENFTVDEVAYLVGDNFLYMDVYFYAATLSGLNQNDIYRRFSLSTSRTRKFYAVLTGSADAVEDYSFAGIVDLQIRLSAGKPSYVSLTILHSQEVQEAIEARPNGDIVINVIDGIGASLEEMVTVNFNEVSYDLVPSSRKITLVGYKTIGFESGTEHEIQNVISKRETGQGIGYIESASPNLSIQPGHIAIYNNLSFIIGEVQFNFSSNFEKMSLTNTANIIMEVESTNELGITGESVSNIFYSIESDNLFGMKGGHHISINNIEIACDESEGLGFTDYVVAELNPL